MKKPMALLDLPTVRDEYQQDAYKARESIKKMHYRGATIVLLADEPRTTELFDWMEEKDLMQYKSAFREDLIKNRFFYFLLRLLPSNWKQYFIRSLFEEIDSGRFENFDTIVFVDSNESNRKAVSALNDTRVRVFSELKDAADSLDLPPEASTGRDTMSED